MRYKRQKRNAPIATLIKNYTNKKSGKVSIENEAPTLNTGGEVSDNGSFSILFYIK